MNQLTLVRLIQTRHFNYFVLLCVCRLFVDSPGSSSTDPSGNARGRERVNMLFKTSSISKVEPHVVHGSAFWLCLYARLRREETVSLAPPGGGKKQMPPRTEELDVADLQVSHLLFFLHLDGCLHATIF